MQKFLMLLPPVEKSQSRCFESLEDGAMQPWFRWVWRGILLVMTLMTIHIICQGSDAYAQGEYGRPRGLGPGWFGHRLKDVSDFQWRVFSAHIPIILSCMTFFICVSQFCFGKNVEMRCNFYICFGIGFLLYIHGACAFWPLFIAMGGYVLAIILKNVPSNGLITWIFHVILLIASKYYDGFDYIDLGSTGIYNWHTAYNLVFLRMISFSLDYYWAKDTTDYTMKNYFAYVFYIPLYIAGPIISFNKFIAQVYTPQTTYSYKDIGKMCFKWICIILTFEFTLHYNYMYAFNLFRFWRVAPPSVVLASGLATLMFMYMKFLTIWRMFRIITLFDGIDVPENMPRCIMNTILFAGFWRSWHQSLHVWIVRYMYVPMGGKHGHKLNVFVIMSFIGMWHDLSWRWQAWALMNIVGLTLERMVMKRQYGSLVTKWYYPWVVIAGILVSDIGLVLANLAILHGFIDTPIYLERAFFTEFGFPLVFTIVYLGLGAGFSRDYEYHKRLALLDAQKST